MTGIIALQGGGPFTANDDLDRRLLAAVGATHVVVLPTADAYEHPQRLVDAADEWAARLGVSVEGLMVLNRRDAMDDAAVAAVRGARAVYLVGDQQLHLRSVVKDTPLWEAIIGVPAGGGLLVGVGGSASALCDPMVDPRGGAFTLGLGLVRGVAFVSDAEKYSAERMHRTEALADTVLAEAPTGAALVRADDSWEIVGAVEVRGELV
jgi:cyanophycinase